MRPTHLLLATMGLLLFVLSSGCDGSGQKRNVQAANDQPKSDSRSEPPSDWCLGDHRTWQDISFSPDGKKIAFTSIYQADQNDYYTPPRRNPDALDTDICVINADGTGMARLTDDPRHDMLPTWSPDGRHLAFIRGLTEVMYDPSPRGDYLVSTVVIMDADGSHERVLPGTRHSQPDDVLPGTPMEMRPLDWSPSGEEIAFSTARCDIYIKPADGSGVASKLPRDPDWGCTKDPAWSPDGKRLAFAGDFGIYVRNLSDGSRETEQVRRLAGGTGPHDTPTWSPDGTEIAFVGSTHCDCIYKMDAGGSGGTELGPGWSPNWLPDGNHIAFLGGVCVASGCAEAHSNAVYEMNPDGSDRDVVDQLPKGAPHEIFRSEG